MRIRSVISLLSGALAIAAGPATAVDGVIEINQARALVGSVTPGDEAGFPVKLFEAGSYRLTGNLTLPDTNTGAIEVHSSQVSIDLNGFSILGPGTCTGCPVTSCTGGTGRGLYVLSNLENISVRNGTIRGMGSEGILLGYQAQIENVVVRDNGGRGISFVGSGHAIVTDSQFVANGGSGVAGTSLTVKGSKAQCNAGSGIELAEGEVSGNTSDRNGEDGILMTAGDGGTIANNLASRNLGCGIRGEHTTVVYNASNNNAVFGIRAQNSLINDNALDSNGFGAIEATGTGTVIGNSVSHPASGQALQLDPNVGHRSNVIAGGCVFGGVELADDACNGVLSSLSGCFCI